MQIKAMLEAWYQQVWIDGNLDAVDMFFKPDTKAAGFVNGFTAGPEDTKEFVTAGRLFFEPLSVAVLQVIQQDNWVSALIQMDLRHREKGLAMSFTGQVMMRMEGPFIVEAYNHFDYISLLEQAELLPPGTMEICLSGQAVGIEAA